MKIDPVKAQQQWKLENERYLGQPKIVNGYPTPNTTLSPIKSIDAFQFLDTEYLEDDVQVQPMVCPTYQICQENNIPLTEDATRNFARRNRKLKLDSVPPPTHIITCSGTVLYFGKQIGSGGYSRCYLTKTRFGHVFAAKTITRAAIDTSPSYYNIEREIKIHHRLHHPNIVRFRQLVESENHISLIMDYCPNRTLNDLILKRGRLLEPESCKVLRSLFSAVAYLHDHFIHHGDLKLSNILLDEKMKPKIGDFGFAKQLKSADHCRKNLCGTPTYMAPEIIEKPCEFGLPSDVWSLGIIAYTLLYGATAFNADTVDATYTRILTHDLKFPEVEPPISELAIECINSMLSPSPKHRPLAKNLIHSIWVSHYFKFKGVWGGSELSDAADYFKTKLRIPANSTDHWKKSIAQRVKLMKAKSLKPNSSN